MSALRSALIACLAPAASLLIVGCNGPQTRVAELPVVRSLTATPDGLVWIDAAYGLTRLSNTAGSLPVSLRLEARGNVTHLWSEPSGLGLIDGLGTAGTSFTGGEVNHRFADGSLVTAHGDGTWEALVIRREGKGRLLVRRKGESLARADIQVDADDSALAAGALRVAGGRTFFLQAGKLLLLEDRATAPIQLAAELGSFLDLQQGQLWVAKGGTLFSMPVEGGELKGRGQVPGESEVRAIVVRDGSIWALGAHPDGDLPKPRGTTVAVGRARIVQLDAKGEVVGEVATDQVDAHGLAVDDAQATWWAEGELRTAPR